MSKLIQNNKQIGHTTLPYDVEMIESEEGFVLQYTTI